MSAASKNVSYAPSPPSSSEIVAFHSWEVVWESKGTTSIDKLAHFAKSASPTKLVFKKKRIIAVEVRRVSFSKAGKKKGTDAHEEEFIRVLTRVKRPLLGGDGLDRGADDDDDGASVSTFGSFAPSHRDLIGPGGWKAGRVHDFGVPESYGGGSSTTPRPSNWTTLLEIPLRDVTLRKHHGKKLQVCARRTDKLKDVKFATDAEADAFYRLVQLLKEKQRVRDGEKFKRTLGSLKVGAEDEVRLLIEIVSCWGLPEADAVGGKSDPYVKVKMGNRTVHRTQYKSGTCDPVYTVKDSSLFILSTNVKELFECQEGLLFEVKDYDSLGRNETLCQVKVPPRVLFEAKSERMVFALHPTEAKKYYKTKTGNMAVAVVSSATSSVGSAPLSLVSSNSDDDGGDIDLGRIAIRCRHATEHDLEFMHQIRNGFKALAEKSPTALTVEGGKNNISSLLTTNTKKSKVLDDPLEKVKKYKVRPGPDPNRKDKTKWMTEAEIQEEAMKRSHHWLDAGTGTLGRIYIEIIGCDGLPNLDSGGMIGNKTDCFVNIIYEDVVVRTDVIADKLSPRWMPWTKRAFMFRMMHSSSQIFLGIFDYDTGLDDHDIVGRVAVDLSTIRPATEYLLHYNIFNTNKLSKRKPRGSITIRLMVKIEDERELLLSALHYTPTYHVNLWSKRDFLAVRYTATGNYGAEKYGWNQINEKIEELMTYKHAFYHLREGFFNVILWRGHAPVTICAPRLCPWRQSNESRGFSCTRKVTFKLPLKSLWTFLAFVVLVEFPNLLPAFVMAVVAFVLTSILDFRRGNPSPWVRARSFLSFLKMLLFGKYSSTPQTIQPYENAEEFEAFQKAWSDRIARYEEEAETAFEDNVKKQAQMQKEMDEIGDTNVDISTKTRGGIGGTGITIDPLMVIWVPLQDALSLLVTYFRFTRNVMIWEECYVAFWVCISSYLFAFIFIFVPWGFLIHWTFRIIIWTFLGPWMKILDIFWDSRIKPFLKKLQETAEAQRRVAVGEQAMAARTAREDATKIAALKKLMFGEYISNVPVYKLSRYRDIPLPESEANPLPRGAWEEIEAERKYTRVHGQHLKGDMIPEVEDPVQAETRTEKTSRVRDLLPRLKKRLSGDEESSERTPLLDEEAGGKSTYADV